MGEAELRLGQCPGSGTAGVVGGWIAGRVVFRQWDTGIAPGAHVGATQKSKLEPKKDAARGRGGGGV